MAGTRPPDFSKSTSMTQPPSPGVRYSEPLGYPRGSEYLTPGLGGWVMLVDFEKSGGLVPAIAQDHQTSEVLMMAWMNREAFDETVRTRRAVYFSRSRGKLWRKGEESGNVQEVREIYVDCDADTILLKVNKIGGARCM